jgi:hypothetical protein
MGAHEVNRIHDIGPAQGIDTRHADHRQTARHAKGGV